MSQSWTCTVYDAEVLCNLQAAAGTKLKWPAHAEYSVHPKHSTPARARSIEDSGNCTSAERRKRRAKTRLRKLCFPSQEYLVSCTFWGL